MCNTKDESGFALLSLIYTTLRQWESLIRTSVIKGDHHIIHATFTNFVFPLLLKIFTSENNVKDLYGNIIVL